MTSTLANWRSIENKKHRVYVVHSESSETLRIPLPLSEACLNAAEMRQNFLPGDIGLLKYSPAGLIGIDLNLRLLGYELNN